MLPLLPLLQSGNNFFTLQVISYCLLKLKTIYPCWQTSHTQLPIIWIISSIVMKQCIDSFVQLARFVFDVKVMPNNLVTQLCCMGIDNGCCKCQRLCLSILKVKLQPKRYDLQCFMARTKAMSSFSYADLPDVHSAILCQNWQSRNLPFSMTLRPNPKASHQITNCLLKYGMTNR